jgi:RNA polymerase-binding transcription factor DksA
MDRKTARSLLMKEEKRLRAILENLEAQTAGTASVETFPEISLADQHPADVGSETFELEKDMSIKSQVEAELADVERSLHRLKDGSFGTCEACGKPIPKQRLEAKPAARFCVKDQARAEREARIA